MNEDTDRPRAGEDPSEAEVVAYAAEHGISTEDARRLLTEHGHDRDRLGEALHNLIHFLRAPS